MLLNNKLLLLSLLSIFYLAPIVGKTSHNQSLSHNGIYYHEPRESSYEITFNSYLNDPIIIMKTIIIAAQKCFPKTEIKSIMMNYNYDRNKMQVVLLRNCTPKLDDFAYFLKKECNYQIIVKQLLNNRG